MYINMFNGSISETVNNDLDNITNIQADIGSDGNDEIVLSDGNENKPIIIDTHNHIEGETVTAGSLNKNIQKASNIDLLSADSQFDIYFESDTECKLNFSQNLAMPFLDLKKVFIKDLGYFDFTDKPIPQLYSEYNLTSNTNSNYIPDVTAFSTTHINDNEPYSPYSQVDTEDMFLVVLNVSYYKIGGFDSNDALIPDNLTNSYGVVERDTSNPPIIVGQKNILEYSYSIINVDKYQNTIVTDRNTNGKTRNFCPFIDLSRASYKQDGKVRNFQNRYYKNNTTDIKSKKIIIGCLNSILKGLYTNYTNIPSNNSIIFFRNNKEETEITPFPILEDIKKPIDNSLEDNSDSFFLLNNIYFTGFSLNNAVVNEYNRGNIQQQSNPNVARINGDFFIKKKSGFFIHCLNSNLVSNEPIDNNLNDLYLLCFNSDEDSNILFLLLQNQSTPEIFQNSIADDIKVKPQFAFQSFIKYQISSLEGFLNKKNKINLIKNSINTNVYIYSINRVISNTEIKSNEIERYNLFGQIEADKVYFKNITFTTGIRVLNAGIRNCVFDNCEGVENILPNYTANVRDDTTGNIVIEDKAEIYGQINLLLNRVSALEDRHKYEIGQIAYFPTTINPPNYLKLDGSSYPESEYPLLFKYFEDKKEELQRKGQRYLEQTQPRTEEWPSGNLRETIISYKLIVNEQEVPYFKIFNFQGMFFRVLDEGAGVNPDRNYNFILKFEEDTFKAHSHSFNTREKINIEEGGKGGERYPRQGASGIFNTDTTGQTETRPKSVLLCAYIKYQ